MHPGQAAWVLHVSHSKKKNKKKAANIQKYTIKKLKRFTETKLSEATPFKNVNTSSQFKQLHADVTASLSIKNILKHSTKTHSL